MEENNFNQQNTTNQPMFVQPDSVEPAVNAPMETPEQGPVTPVMPTAPVDNVTPATPGFNPVPPVSPTFNTAPVTPNYNQAPMNTPVTEPKKSNTTLIIIIAAVVVAALIAVYFLFIKDDNNISNGGNGGSSGTGTVKEKIKLEENLVVTEHLQFKEDYDSYVILKIKNGNNVSTDLEINVEFYDASQNIIDTEDEEVYGIASNSETYVSIETDKEFASYEYTVKARESISDPVTAANIGTKVTASDSQYIIQVTNNSSIDEILYRGVLVQYKNEKVVAVNKVYAFDIRKGETVSTKASFGYQRGYIVPDRYELLFSESINTSY